MRSAVKIVGSFAAFCLLVLGLVTLLEKTDHYDQRHAFEKACRRDGYFLEYKDGRVINCINGSHKIMRQYLR